MMSAIAWKDALDKAYDTFLEEPPKSNQDVVDFAAVYYLIDKFQTNHTGTSIFDTIKRLENDITDRIENETSLHNILKDIEELISILWTGTSSNDERDLIVEFLENARDRYD